MVVWQGRGHRMTILGRAAPSKALQLPSAHSGSVTPASFVLIFLLGVVVVVSLPVRLPACNMAYIQASAAAALQATVNVFLGIYGYTASLHSLLLVQNSTCCCERMLKFCLTRSSLSSTGKQSLLGMAANTSPEECAIKDPKPSSATSLSSNNGYQHVTPWHNCWFKF